MKIYKVISAVLIITILWQDIIFSQPDLCSLRPVAAGEKLKNFKNQSLTPKAPKASQETKRLLAELLKKPADFDWKTLSASIPYLKGLLLGRTDKSGKINFSPVKGYLFQWFILGFNEAGWDIHVIDSGPSSQGFFQFTVELSKKGKKPIRKTFQAGPYVRTIRGRGSEKGKTIQVFDFIETEREMGQRILAELITRPGDFDWEKEKDSLPKLDGYGFGITEAGGKIRLGLQEGYRLTWPALGTHKLGRDWKTRVVESGVKNGFYRFTVRFSKEGQSFEKTFQIGPFRRALKSERKEKRKAIVIFDILDTDGELGMRIISHLVTRPKGFDWKNAARDLPRLDGLRLGSTNDHSIIVFYPFQNYLFQWPILGFMDKGWEAVVVESGLREGAYRFTVELTKPGFSPRRRTFQIGPQRKTLYGRKDEQGRTVMVFDLTCLTKPMELAARQKEREEKRVERIAEREVRKKERAAERIAAREARKKEREAQRAAAREARRNRPPIPRPERYKKDDWGCFRALLHQMAVSPNPEEVWQRLRRYRSDRFGHGGIEVEVKGYAHHQTGSYRAGYKVGHVYLFKGAHLSLPQRFVGKRVHIIPKFENHTLYLEIFELTPAGPRLFRLLKQRRGKGNFTLARPHYEERLRDIPVANLPTVRQRINTGRDYNFHELTAYTGLGASFFSELCEAGYIYLNPEGKIPGDLFAIIVGNTYRLNRQEYPLSVLRYLLGVNYRADVKVLRSGIPLIKRPGQEYRISRESALTLVLKRKIRDWMKSRFGGFVPAPVVCDEIGLPSWVLAGVRGNTPFYNNAPLWVRLEKFKFFTRDGLDGLKSKIDRARENIYPDEVLLLEALKKRWADKSPIRQGKLFLESFRAIQELGVPYRILEHPLSAIHTFLLIPRKDADRIFAEVENPTVWSAPQIREGPSYSTETVARLLGLGRRTMASRIEKGKIATRKIFGRHWVSGQELIKLLLMKNKAVSSHLTLQEMEHCI